MDAITINQTTPLVDLIGNLKPSGRYHIGPCPFCGGRDRFNVYHADDGDLWHCRGCGDGRYQDVVSFFMKRDGLTFPQVLAAHGGTTGAGSHHTTLTREARRPALDTAPPEDWQSAALTALAQCSDASHWERTAAARAAYGYLINQRGLTTETIYGASLGFNTTWRDIPGAGRLAPGITMPAMIAGQLWYVQVRTTKTARAAAQKDGRQLDKYHALTGSKLKALFQADKLLTAETAVVTEGEFDALLLSQFLPDGWTAVTMGSAGALPDNPAWLRYFAAVQRVYVVMDNDEAGQTAVGKWRGLLPWVDLLPVPEGHNDVTDYWQAGGDLAAWVNQ